MPKFCIQLPPPRVGELYCHEIHTLLGMTAMGHKRPKRLSLLPPKVPTGKWAGWCQQQTLAAPRQCTISEKVLIFAEASRRIS
jgi:hypothetical protein